MSKIRPPKNPVNRNEYVISRLRQVLSRHKETSTWRRISKAILAANGGDGNATVDRRTLPLICSDDEFEQVRLSLAQLVALDKYFMVSHEGPLFARNRSLIDSISESSAVAFYVATKYHKGLYADAVSAFDFRAMMILLSTGLGRLDIRINDISDMTDWHKAKAGNEMVANIAIGSPIGNPAADALLSNMLGFIVNKNTGSERLPFFIVRRRRERGRASGFVRTKLDAIKRNATAAQKITADERALVVDDRIFVCSDKSDYALLVAQRNPDGGHVRTVLAGLTGLGTRELARILRAGGPTIVLPEVRDKEKHPPILTAVYEFTVEGRHRKSKKSVETRSYAGSTPIYGPSFLNHSDGGWRRSASVADEPGFGAA